MAGELDAANREVADKKAFSIGLNEHGGDQGKIKNTKFTWGAFRKLLLEPLRDNIQLERYLKLSKDSKQARKNKGFYTTTTFEGRRRRKTQSRKEHTIIALDVDAASIEVFKSIMKPDEVLDVLGPFEYFAHITRNHDDKAPRVRVVLPLKHALGPDEFSAACRLLAYKIDANMEMVDPVCFRTTQVSYLPSVSIGQEYKTKHNSTGRFLDAMKDVLEPFGDDDLWRDLRALPRGPRDKIRVVSDKAQHPDQKHGWVGAFCRARPIMDHMRIMQELGYYEPAEDGPTPVRWSYSKGTTHDGVMLYVEDGRKQSWHGSDPTCDMNLHGFDDYRIHVFGHLDADEDYDENTNPTARESYKAMIHALQTAEEFADVREEYTRSEYDREAQKDDAADDAAFMADLEDEQEVTSAPGAIADAAEAEFQAETEIASSKMPDLKPTKDERKAKKADLLKLLDMKKDDKNPGPKNTTRNVRLIIEHQEAFLGVFRYNELTNRVVLTRPIVSKQLDIHMPTRITDRVNGFPMQDHIATIVREIISSPHGPGKVGWGLQIGPNDVKDVVDRVARQNAFHPIKRYFLGLKWDGKPRLRKLLHRYFKSRDDEYHDQVSFMLCLGAIARVFEPGHKFDFLIVLEGYQGCGKSTGVEVLAVLSDWYGEFSVDLSRGSGKKTQEIIENLEGKLLVEWPELSTMTRSEAEPVKALLSARRRTARMAYGRYAEDSLPGCIFIGTVNPEQYLRDPTGNRRFLPVKLLLNESKGERVDVTGLRRDIHQIWAEAMAYYTSMRELDYPKEEFPDLPLYVKGAAAKVAKAEQQLRVVTNTDEDIWPGQIRAWLDSPPDDEDADLPSSKKSGSNFRNWVCVSMVWRECLSLTSRKPTREESLLIGKILSTTDGWINSESSHRFGRPYGSQKAWRRIEARDDPL